MIVIFWILVVLWFMVAIGHPIYCMKRDNVSFEQGFENVKGKSYLMPLWIIMLLIMLINFFI